MKASSVSLSMPRNTRRKYVQEVAQSTRPASLAMPWNMLRLCARCGSVDKACVLSHAVEYATSIGKKSCRCVKLSNSAGIKDHDSETQQQAIYSGGRLTVFCHRYHAFERF